MVREFAEGSTFMVRWMHKCRTDVGFNAKKMNALCQKHVFSKKRKDNEIHVAFGLGEKNMQISHLPKDPTTNSKTTNPNLTNFLTN